MDEMPGASRLRHDKFTKQLLTILATNRWNRVTNRNLLSGVELKFQLKFVLLPSSNDFTFLRFSAHLETHR